MATLFQQDLFDADGHLTEATLAAFVVSDSGDKESTEETPYFSSLQRLEIAEHLSFCDHCILRYTQMLTEDMLLTPSDLVVPAVMNRLEKADRQKMFSKYASVVLAAGFAILFWVSGVFSLDFYQRDTGFLTELTKGISVFNQQTLEFSMEISNGISDFIDNLNLRGEYSHGKK